ncbi:MAG: 2-amino-4-hydroxy-6-hydroxymethyldihydropteridine diphosphokinase [Phycisphaerae bacterium]
MNRAVVCFGSNIDAHRNVATVLELLAADFDLLARSDPEWTRPVGRSDQPDFLNGAVLLETSLDRDAVVEKLHAIEETLGRVRDPADPDGPRTMDLDVVVWNGQVVHDDYHNRPFVRRAVEQLREGDCSWEV